MKKVKENKTLQSGFHALVWQEGKWFVAKCLEMEIASQGKTKLEALKNLEEALELYFEDEKVTPPDTLTNPEIHSISVPLYA